MKFTPSWSIPGREAGQRHGNAFLGAHVHRLVGVLDLQRQPELGRLPALGDGGEHAAGGEVGGRRRVQRGDHRLHRQAVLAAHRGQFERCQPAAAVEHVVDGFHRLTVAHCLADMEHVGADVHQQGTHSVVRCARFRGDDGHGPCDRGGHRAGYGRVDHRHAALGELLGERAGLFRLAAGLVDDHRPARQPFCNAVWTEQRMLHVRAARQAEHDDLAPASQLGPTGCTMGTELHETRDGLRVQVQDGQRVLSHQVIGQCTAHCAQADISNIHGGQLLDRCPITSSQIFCPDGKPT